MRRLRRVFLALDNMYGELIASGELEAYLATPPIFYQDSFFSDSGKLGERGVRGLSHRPFSVLCIEQEVDLDLTVLRIVSPDGAGGHKQAEAASGSSLLLSVTDNLADNSWRGQHPTADLLVEYATFGWTGAGADEGAPRVLVSLGSIQLAQTPELQLEVDEASVCWPDPVDCTLFVLLKERNGSVLDHRVVQLRESMFVGGTARPRAPDP